MKKSLVAFACTLAVAMATLAGCASANQAPQTQEEVAKDVVGIIGAMDIEVDSLKKEANAQDHETIAGMEFYPGKLGDKDVIIVKCGVGKVNAGICAHTLINHFGCDRIINTGVAGSLDNDIDIGDIVVSVDVVQHDFDASPVGFQKGEIPYTGLYAFPADESLRASAVKAVEEAAPDIKVFEGRICTGDQFITTREQKDKITGDFGGMCCEMEGGAIAQACYINDIPFVIIRAISDKEDGSHHVEYELFAEEAAETCSKAVQYMVENIME
jgi:adenosylhomocysteine nucleosidase